MATWSLPENIEDVLPADAAKLERMRRIALDTFVAYGYELVIPPLLEYVESLLSGVGHDMDLATFKLVDQLSGRMMGLRADTTPQVARIDAHVLNRRGVTRLCYAGSVLHTLPSGLGKSRQPFQVGAELYGHAGLDADIEIQQLMLDILSAVGVRAVRLDIGQPSIFRSLADAAGLAPQQREMLFAAVSGKDSAALAEFAGNTSSQVPAELEMRRAIARLPTLYGQDAGRVIAQAREQLPALPGIETALDQLANVAAHFSAQGLAVSIDLGELGGFNYESGIAFAAFTDGASEAIARGGRYDDIGLVFGRARPATGFSMDLKSLLVLVDDVASSNKVLLAPGSPDREARAAMAAFRKQGYVVIGRLDGNDEFDAALITHVMTYTDGKWQIQAKGL
ncbi:MAG: ATP phosphoribosyltransferase regulatory subunit [Rhodocyclaceae bacterium]|nr:ATP phosphoribosyltransferase regulatory subunit [Rhodocyclaceae bacterium]